MIDMFYRNVNQHTSLHYVIIIETINNNMLGFNLRTKEIFPHNDLTENYMLEELKNNEY